MRILYYFKEKDTLMDKWQRYHIFDELERHDCHVIVFNPLDYSTIEEANEKLCIFINTHQFDLFMTPHGSEDLYVNSLQLIKQRGLPSLLICFDNLIVPFYHQKIAPHFDLVWLTSKETKKMFTDWGANVLLNPYAANPYYFKPNYTVEIERVAFIGTPYGSRVNMLNLLTRNEVDVSLFSNISAYENDQKNNNKIKDYIYPAYNLLRFPTGRKVILGAIKQKIQTTNKLDIENDFLDLRPTVSLERLSELYSTFALSLASTAARNTGVLKNPVNIVNLRSFEIPMSGGLQICAFFDELAEYFEEDKEIIYYRTNDEFIEKSKFYLKSENKHLRTKLKSEARRRSETEHTWLQRFRKVFDYFGLKYKEYHI